jgi:large subunit ribosomal protein L4e
MMKASVFSIKGRKIKELELPSVFRSEIRQDLIRRAVIASQSNRRQPQGVDPFAGKRTSAESWGPGRGVSRVPRIKGRGHRAAGRGAFVPQAVGGREAHPPVVQKIIKKKINVKERKKAIASAIAATGKMEMVKQRGHVIDNIPQVPLIVSDKIEALKKTRDTKETFIKLGIWEDIKRAKQKKIRPGKGKMRGRKYKKKKSALIVVSEDRGIRLGARNHPGIDVVKVEELGVEHLAPGGNCGRLTLYSESALEKLEERF